MEKKQFILLVNKYLEGQATETEKQLLEDCLQRLEANGEAIPGGMPEDLLRQSMWQHIQQQTCQQPSPVVPIAAGYRKKIFRRIAVAAAIVLAAGLAIQLYMNPGHTPALAVKQKMPDSSQGFLRHEVNQTGKEKNILLPDGSLIVLAAKSEISYREPFVNKREIVLSGKAYFKVAKDKTRPFTVISRDISTTALGTAFTVTAFKNTGNIIIRLYEGRVVIKALEKGNKQLKNDVYLSPGLSFIYGSRLNNPVKKFPLHGGTAPENIINGEISLDKPFIPQNAEGSWYMFNNQSLAQVFDQLAEMHQVQINYDRKTVQNIYFIGKYNVSDSIENILKEIVTLNNLTMTRKDNIFIISRKK